KTMNDYINIGAFLFAFLGFGIPVLALIKQSNEKSDKRDREFTAYQRDFNEKFNTHIAEFNAQTAQRDREWMEFRREFFNKKD
ncbi:MAG: hypothetical protein RR927_04995, partial [Victivallaceae bacterium]